MTCYEAFNYKGNHVYEDTLTGSKVPKPSQGSMLKGPGPSLGQLLCTGHVWSQPHGFGQEPPDHQGCHLSGITQQREDSTDFLRQHVSAGRRRVPSFEIHCLTGRTAISTSNTNPMCSNVHAGNTARTAAFKNDSWLLVYEAVRDAQSTAHRKN